MNMFMSYSLIWIAHLCVKGGGRLSVPFLLKTDDDSVVLRYSNGTEIILTEEGGQIQQGRFPGRKNDEGIQFTDGIHTIQVEYKYEPVGTHVVHLTHTGELLIQENEALIGIGVYVESRISKYADGKMIASALALPTNDYAVKVPRHYMYANDLGEAYQMILRDDHIHIQQLSFSKERKTRLTDDLVAKIQPQSLED